METKRKQTEHEDSNSSQGSHKNETISNQATLGRGSVTGTTANSIFGGGAGTDSLNSTPLKKRAMTGFGLKLMPVAVVHDNDTS